MLLFISSHIEKRTWSQLLSLVPRCKAFALPIKSKRATRISPTKGLYTTKLADDWVQLWLYIISEAYICIHLTRGVSRCFVLDLMIRVCEVLHRQNQSVQKTPFSICSFLPAGKGHFRRWRYVSYLLTKLWAGLYAFGFDDLILLKPFHTMMSIGRVCYTDVTPFYCFFTIYSSSSFSSGSESQRSAGGR